MNNVIHTKVSIFRNLKDYKFSEKLTIEQKQEIVEKLKTALKTKMSLLNINNADENVKKYLIDNGLLSGNTQNLFVSKNESVAINLFNVEHVNIISTTEGFDKNAILKATELANFLSNKISFAFSDEFGYLMADLNKIGSGLKIECNIALSAIKSINKIEQIKQNVSKLGYSLKETKFPAIYTLSTTCNLGISEKKIFEDFETTISKLQELELESLKMLDVQNHDEIVDKTNRSIAILNSAYLMTHEELYNLLVNIRMGLNLGLVNIDIKTLNKLQKLANSKTKEYISQTELKIIAEQVKEILKGEKDV